MYTLKDYVMAESLEQAYALLQKRSNRILAGGMWMRLGTRSFGTAIDLSGLGLDKIEEKPEEFVIGCMTPLRALETHEAFGGWFGGIPGEAVSGIVGTQFRNTATVGGSIYGRFGFSDVLTAFLVLDTTVELYHGGMIPLETFAKRPYERDILVNLHVKKDRREAAYESMRQSATDFPVLTVAVSRLAGRWRVAVGARPARAALAEAAGLLSPEPAKGELDAFCRETGRELAFGDNMRGSADYRRMLAGVLTERAVKRIVKGGVR